ncbi:MAG: RHS repeat-associated core domain-containing protein [Myxococcota bacterium]
MLEARHDEVGQLAAIVPPGREIHALDFDALGQMEAYVAPESCVGVSSPDCVETSDDVLAMSYTLDREPASTTYPSDAGLAQQVRYTYDHWENPSTSLNRTVPSPDFTGNLLRIDDPVGARVFGYYDETASDTDAYRLRSVSDAAADGSGSAGSLVYAWNGARLSSVSRSGTGSGSVGLGYDERFLLSEMQVAAFGTSPVAVPFTYDGDGVPMQAGSMSLTPSSQYRGIASMSLGSTTTVRTLNAFAELSGETTTFSGAARYSLDTSARDGMGRIATKTEVLNDGSGSTTLRTDFEYDLRGRVSEVYESSSAGSRGPLVREYTYDDNGNRLSVLDGSGAVVESGVYDGQDRLIEYVRDGTTARYTYRDRGALWTKSVGSDVTEYEYDVWGNLRSVDLPESVDPGAADIEYTIDGQNRRVGKWRNGELVQELLYQDQLNPVAVRDRADGSSSWTTKRFVYASRPNVPDFMVVNESDTYRLLVDQVGSVRAVVNVDTGAVAQVIDYDEFGRVLSDSNPGFQPFGFAGGLYDQDTDLVRFGARDYDPETGRWTSKDPILFEGFSWSLYQYVEGDPVNLLDPEGEFAISGGTSVGIAIAGGFGSTVAGLGAASFGVGYGIGTAINYFAEDGIQSFLDWALDPDGSRRRRQPNKPGRKKQGREPGEKKRQHPGWKPRNPPKEPKRHTPGREHRRPRNECQ